MSTDLTTFDASLPVVPRGRGVAAKSVAVVKALVAPYADAFEDGKLCEKIRYSGNLVFEDGHGGTRHFPRLDNSSHSLTGMVLQSRIDNIARAKVVREILKPSYVLSIGKSIELLDSLVEPDRKDIITADQAAVMVQALFSAIAGNKKTREDQGRLSACVAMFDPVVSIIGEATELWDEVPRHPVVVALGIMHLLYEEQVFSPAPKELADAIRKAGDRLENRLWNMRWVCDQLARAEEIVFDHARDEWKHTTRKSIDAAVIARRYSDRDRRWDHWSEWWDALEEIREAISKNENANTSSADVKAGATREIMPPHKAPDGKQ